MKTELGTWMTLITAVISFVGGVLYEEYRNKKDNNIRIQKQQLDKLYNPIYKKIDDYYRTNAPDEGYFGLHEEAIIDIVTIIHDNSNIADSELLNWRDNFNVQIYESQYLIRPHNEDYDPLYDTDKKFFLFVKSKLTKLRENIGIK